VFSFAQIGPQAAAGFALATAQRGGAYPRGVAAIAKAQPEAVLMVVVSAPTDDHQAAVTISDIDFLKH